MPAQKFKANTLEKAFYLSTYERYELIAPNIYLDWGYSELDLMGLRRSGFIDEIEIKVTKSDFNADFKKSLKIQDSLIQQGKYSHYSRRVVPKHECLPKGLAVCNYFSFLLPEDLAEKVEIPVYAGLYTFYVDNAGIGRVREVKKAPLLHRRKLPLEKKYEIGRKMAYRYWHHIKMKQG